MVKSHFWILLLSTMVGTSLAQDTFTVATLNVNAGSSTASNAVAAIRSSAADIVIIQEPNPRMASILKQTFATEYQYSDFTDPGHSYSYYVDRLGILSKHPVQVRFIPPVAGSAFGSQVALVHLGTNVIQVVNVHLDPPRLLDSSALLRSLKDLADRETTRVAELKAIFTQLQPGLPTILAGDFNAIASSPTVTFMHDNGFIDTHASQTNRLPEDTWHGSIDGVPISLRIDYVFSDQSFQPIRTAVLPCESSDHCLAVTEMASTNKTRHPSLAGDTSNHRGSGTPEK